MTIKITFPDGSTKEFEQGITPFEIAKSIGERLAMATIAAKVSGNLVDASYPIPHDAHIQLITSKDKEALEILRHSAAHLMAQAIMRMYPDAKLTIGPVVEEGFYYDIDTTRKFSTEDFKVIEQEMEKLVKENIPIHRTVLTKKEALHKFAANEYKVELINELPEHEIISCYSQGEFIDLCRGPHVPSTGFIKAFKLMKVAGAYWRANAENKQLQRIYGIAFFEKKELESHLTLLAEAEKRDHRKLGRELDLFLFSDLVGPGLPLWTPRGTLLRNLLDDYVWSLRSAKGYQRVCIPHLTKKELYETSGHWVKYGDDLFKTVSREGHVFALKPMNCPHHTQIYAGNIRSYRDLPQRYAETTACYRDEQSGELSGLSRVRGLTQDDAHVFCRHNQIKDEFMKIWDIVDTFYPTFGFKLRVRLSLHDPNNMKAYLGDEQRWNQAEDILRDIAKERNADFHEGIGEAAFYGAKIDFMTKDSLGREWQVATIQLDMNMPERFDLYCINETGAKERVAMIHAAIMGSLERFLSVLIEHLAGKFPLWLAPVQITLLPIADRHVEHCHALKKEWDIHGLRVDVDDRTETMQKKVRDAQMQKIPLMITIGDKEIDNHTLAVRTLDGNVKFGVKKEDFLITILELIKSKALNVEI
ncbi:MAG: threonine--tRNA ligase [Candidatus Woesearchaeota archaeon]